MGMVEKEGLQTEQVTGLCGAVASFN